MWRQLLGALLLTGLGALVGATASLTVSTGSLGAAALTIPRCSAAGLSVVQNLAASTVVSVTVGGIPAACGGALLQVGVHNGVTSGNGSATVLTGGGSVTVTLGVAVAVTTVEQTDLLLVGP
ncbi:MAG: hypothetical protein ABIZ57_10640 [Candidatus Limnocylindria bacterium]